MTTANKKELIIGVAMLGVSATYMVMAYRLPGHEGIDAATVPFLLAALLSLLGREGDDCDGELHAMRGLRSLSEYTGSHAALAGGLSALVSIASTGGDEVRSAAIATLYADGVTRIELTVEADNPRAQRFYERYFVRLPLERRDGEMPYVVWLGAA